MFPKQPVVVAAFNSSRIRTIVITTPTIVLKPILIEKYNAKYNARKIMNTK